ncbi:MAG TPA: DUF2877 domain-containing protein [Anaerolineales bacterium]|nr:DUF2877 domain-containing protein [Anaerolineales bacterium]
MNFHAISIGSSVPRADFNATIQSVFDSSLNLRLEHQDALLTILVSDHYDLPQGIRLTVKNVPLSSLTVDVLAACRNGILRFQNSLLSIDLRGARIWNGRLSASIDMQRPASGRAWSMTWKALNKQQRLKQTDLIGADLFKANAGSLLTRMLSQPVQRLIAATEQLDSQAAADSAAKMIGLGPGVTPSGDDLLLGYLAGLWSTAAQEQQRLDFLSKFGQSLSALKKETNEISRTYLYYAIKGEFSSSMLALVNAISDGEEPKLLSTAKEAMRVGHSSGLDSVTGLLIGLTAWDSTFRHGDLGTSKLDGYKRS